MNSKRVEKETIKTYITLQEALLSVLTAARPPSRHLRKAHRWAEYKEFEE